MTQSGSCYTTEDPCECCWSVPLLILWPIWQDSWMWNWTRQLLFSCHFFVGSKTFDRHTDLGRLNQLWHLPEVIENNTKLHFWNSRHNMCQQKLDSVWSFLCDEGKNPMCSTIKACSPIQLYSWSTSVLITWNPAYIPGLYDGFVMFWLRHHSQLFVPRG